MDDPQLKAHSLHAGVPDAKRTSGEAKRAELLTSAPNSQSTFQRVDEYPRPSRFGTTLSSHSYYNHTMLNKCYSAT